GPEAAHDGGDAKHHRQQAHDFGVPDEVKIRLRRQQLDKRPSTHRHHSAIGSFLGLATFSHQASPTCATRTADSIEVKTPMVSVQAKPRTGPAPKMNMIRAATSVVRLASTMVPMALLKPA